MLTSVLAIRNSLENGILMVPLAFTLHNTQVNLSSTHTHCFCKVPRNEEVNLVDGFYWEHIQIGDSLSVSSRAHTHTRKLARSLREKNEENCIIKMALPSALIKTNTDTAFIASGEDGYRPAGNGTGAGRIFPSKSKPEFVDVRPFRP